MKLKIKLKKINEAIATPGQDAMADIEARKATDEYDPDKMDQEIEATVDREEGKKTLKALLKVSPLRLPGIKEVIAAHNKAIGQQYNFDHLFETIRELLENSETGFVNVLKKEFNIEIKLYLEN